MKEFKTFSYRDKETGERVQYVVVIDWNWIALQTAQKLHDSPSGKTQAMNGAITAKRVKHEEP